MARKHDETYKLIFSQRAAVEELIRDFVGKGLADELDFDTLEPLPPNRISAGLIQRQMDLLCKVRFRDGMLTGARALIQRCPVSTITGFCHYSYDVFKE